MEPDLDLVPTRRLIEELQRRCEAVMVLMVRMNVARNTSDLTIMSAGVSDAHAFLTAAIDVVDDRHELTDEQAKDI